MAELLENPWFKHFIAVWRQERDYARAAVCDFPIKDYATTVTALQTRGEAVAYDAVVNMPHKVYEDLVAEAREKEREDGHGNGNSGGDSGPDDFTVA